MLLREGVKAGLFNTQKQTQRGCQIEETKKYGPNERTEKELNEMEITNLSDAEFKTLVIRMLKELNEYSNNIKEDMKVTLNEIKKNLQGAISGGEEARIQTNELEQKEDINIQPEQKQETRIQKKEDRLRTSGTSPNMPTSES